MTLIAPQLDKRPFLYFIILVFLGIGFFTAGCKATPVPIDPRLVDQSFITGQPCEAPCWYGLVPDQSSESEVLPKLKELPFVDHTKIKEWKNSSIFGYSNASELDFNCAFPGNVICGVVVSFEGVVKYIDLAIQYSLPLKSVIDRLGTPEYIFTAGYSPHGDGCRVSFNWPQKRISVVSVDPDSSQPCQDLDMGKAINSDILITEVHYEAKDIALQDRCRVLKCITWPGFLDK
jgi:hypothetical protein